METPFMTKTQLNNQKRKKNFFYGNIRDKGQIKKSIFRNLAIFGFKMMLQTSLLIETSLFSTTSVPACYLNSHSSCLTALQFPWTK